MKRISTVAISLIFASIFTVAAYGQAPQALKIGWIDTAQFADEKEGVTKYNNALKALDTEMKPRVTELTGLQTRLQKIAEEIRTATNVPAGVPVNQQIVAQKQDEGQRLQREFEFKQKEAQAIFGKRREEVLGPITQNIFQALQDYEADMEQQAFMKAVVKGIVDLEEGRELSISEVKTRLKLKI